MNTTLTFDLFILNLPCVKLMNFTMCYVDESSHQLIIDTYRSMKESVNEYGKLTLTQF